MAANAPGVLGALFDAADTANSLGALCTGIGFGLDSIYGPPPSDLKVAGSTVPVAHIGVTPPYVAAQACGFAGKVPTFAINGTGAPIPDGAVMTPGSGVNRSGKACLVGAGVYAVDAVANLFTKTEAFDNGVWTKSRCSVTPDTVVAPSLLTTADVMVEDTATGGHYVYANNQAVVANTVYTASVFLKANGRNYAQLQFYDGAGNNGAHAGFDLVNGVCTPVVAKGLGTQAAATIVSAGNGWWRCAITVNVDPTSTTIDFLILAALSLSNVVGSEVAFTGSGGPALALWGAQLERSPGPNPYVAVP